MGRKDIERILHGVEAQCLRKGKVIRDLLYLLQNAKEDGGLSKAQCEELDKLTAQNKTIMTGRDGALYGLSPAERGIVAEFLDDHIVAFCEVTEEPEDAPTIISRLRVGVETIKGEQDEQA